MNFEILNIDAIGRIGKIELGRKEIITPNLFPVVHPFLNTITPRFLQEIGINCIFTNAYILYKNKIERELAIKKGLHNYLDFDGIIATDSGAFQQYMYNDKEIQITAELIENFQENIKSDFPVILDIPVQPDDDFLSAKKKVELSIKRAKDNIERRKLIENWIGPIHGGIYPDLLKISALQMSKLDFSIYAIGGLVKYFLEYRFKDIINMLLTVKEKIIPNKPIHMFGLGLPQFFSLAVACGCDLMDSAAYILYAKENRYFTLTTGTKNLNELIEFPCYCPICSNFTPDEIRQLPDTERIEKIAKHNIYLSLLELKTIRQAIREGNLWELVEQRIRTHPNLIEAFKLIEKKYDLFETNEKIYKPHGRLFSSQLSRLRPIISRYHQIFSKRFKISEKVEYVIIFPELDTKVYKSISMQEWLKKIYHIPKQHHEKIQVLIFSSLFGLIPLELSQTYPLGQFEWIIPSPNCQENYSKSLDVAFNFLKSLKYNVECYFFVPKTHINEFYENKNLNTEIIDLLFQKIQNISKITIRKYLDINNLLENLKLE